MIAQFHKNGYGYVSRGKVQGEMNRIKRQQALSLDSAVPHPIRQVLFASSATTASSISDEFMTDRSRGGRPKGITNEVVRNERKQIAEATVTASKRFKQVRDNARLRGRDRCVKGTLASIINAVEEEYGLPAGTLDSNTIRQRVDRNNLSGQSESRTSPLLEIEPVLVEYCIRLARIGQPLTKDQLTGLAISMIEGTSIEEKLNAWKKKYSHFNDKNELLGDGWYQGFINRNSLTLSRVRARMKDINRVLWCTYSNFEQMYKSVYQRMVEAKVAVRLPEPVWFNRDGEIMENEEDSIGLKSDIHIIHPEWIVFVDETGVNTNQKDDGNLGGELFIVPSDDFDARLQGATTDIHFTVLCFQSGNGEPILCAVVMKSEKDAKDIPTSWKLGIDVTTKLSNPNDDGMLLLEQNSESMKGGPNCTFRGKVVPCFVCTSPKASITSQLLADMLGHMDAMNIWERTETSPTPFLLLDGHHSRMELAFLDYIHDKKHPWAVCIGVPYGTHIWQVADASECNGTFKMGVTRAKRVIFDARPDGKKQFTPTDIIPIINKSFPGSYGNVEFAKKAIAKRGWFPATFALLNDPAIAKTRERNNNTTTNSSISEPDAPTHQLDVPILNMETGLAGKITDKLLANELKKDGRKDKLRRERQEKDDQFSLAKKIRNATRITSGGLASLNHYSLDTDVLQAVQANYTAAAEKETERKTNRAAASALAEKKRHKAEEAVRAGGKLSVDTLRVLIQSRKQRDDSPMKSTREELELQWNRRLLREQNKGTTGEIQRI